jgi:hypothetical protein
MKVRYIKRGPTILEFSVQYETLIGSHWHKVLRFDNAHQQRPHSHKFYPHESQLRRPMSQINCNIAFTYAQTEVKQNYLALRESYIMQLEGKKKP